MTIRIYSRGVHPNNRYLLKGVHPDLLKRGHPDINNRYIFKGFNRYKVHISP